MSPSQQKDDAILSQIWMCEVSRAVMLFGEV